MSEAELYRLVEQCDGFDWDEGNSTKNWIKHRVSMDECEQAFGNAPLLAPDYSHSIEERRLVARSKTDSGRCLFISFTVRGTLIRVISARPMDRRERADYEEIERAS